MSTSLSCETELREIADELRSQAYDLEKAADVLQVLRDEEKSKEMREKIKSAKEWAKGWMK